MPISRSIMYELRKGLQDSPVVLLVGARQVGKSTLSMQIKNTFTFFQNAEYITLDDPHALAFASKSPFDFIEQLPKKVIIDEVQLVPELFRAIKLAVDRDKKRRFMLTGSANVLLIPRLSDSLAGRMEIYELQPLALSEIYGSDSNFIDMAYSGNKLFSNENPKSINLFSHIVCGGYPEAYKRKVASRRDIWFKSYIQSILERNIKNLSDIVGLRQAPTLLTLLATEIGNPLNTTDISRISGVPITTLQRYLNLFNAVYLYKPLPSWHKKLSIRFIKSPKVYFNDTGLVCYLRGIDEKALRHDASLAGVLVEHAVINELRNQLLWSQQKPTMYYLRTATGNEIDVVLEKNDGTLVAIEITISKNISVNDISAMQHFRKLSPKKFHRGILLYGGTKVIKFDDQIVAIPISSIWS